ncbi:MAG: hypothetical protein H5U06_04175 [Candidatus Aminicenantes bacterium]|nr:hypothetical protein [Candidatus Aminicenantes bacterium]
MKKTKLFALGILLISLAFMSTISINTMANEPVKIGGKKVLTGPNGQFGCDCTQEEYVDCWCLIIKPI